MEQEAPAVYTIDTVIDTLHRGALRDELDTELAEVVEAVRMSSKKGLLTLAIEVVPQGKDAEIVSVHAKVTSKQPKPDQAGSLFYPDTGGRLHRHDPRQGALPFERD